MVFDASINSDFFDVKDNGETISALKSKFVLIETISLILLSLLQEQL